MAGVALVVLIVAVVLIAVPVGVIHGDGDGEGWEPLKIEPARHGVLVQLSYITFVVAFVHLSDRSADFKGEGPLPCPQMRPPTKNNSIQYT